ncbi:hypothetical protein ENKNEFLB_00441 [Nocardioides aquaticus]|uniref:Uncharacterized protein n=1 Tax=Nocardioides aquaticus TaxID=160826 RepID=A0ABX8ECH4_9ACTN|nr:hypothetical protein [Nocardioides aquaticus]QVT78069.1 hypothetical protein ENKNEFLB_00441 [Nocardioides aquaticus]
MSNWTPSRPASQLLREALPLQIRGTETTDPVVTLFGESWSLTLWCDWTVESMSLSSSSPDLEDRVWDLVSLSIVGLEVVENVGPIFRLSSGHQLALMEGDDEEPWVMQIPGLIITGGTRSEYWG